MKNIVKVNKKRSFKKRTPRESFHSIKSPASDSTVVCDDTKTMDSIQTITRNDKEDEILPPSESDSMAKLRIMKMKNKSVPPIFGAHGKRQSSMLAQAPIKQNSKRINPTKIISSHAVDNNAAGTLDSKETLRRVNSGEAPTSLQSLAKVGSVRLSGSLASSRGLTVKTVRHTVNRLCMWYHPAHTKAEWSLKGKNNWRKD